MRAVVLILKPGLNHFRKHAYDAARPAWVKHNCLSPSAPYWSLPASKKWFLSSQQRGLTNDAPPTLNIAYLKRHGSNEVPVEMTILKTIASPSGVADEAPLLRWAQKSMPLADFAELCDFKATAKEDRESQGETQDHVHLYLAQCPISSLSPVLRDDLPAPELVLQAARGDIYQSSIWLGKAPTYTPLHKDPNPNLLVQLAGTKTIRLLSPQLGRLVFEEVKSRVGSAGQACSRGEEMMQGDERKLLEDMIWMPVEKEIQAEMYETALESGDGLFIPQGWWHSVKGIGEGINGSVNWWFR